MKKDGSQKRKNNRIAEIRVDHFFARTFGAIGTTNRREEAGASTDNSTTLQTLCERCTRKYHHADTPQPSAENYIPCLCLALLYTPAQCRELHTVPVLGATFFHLRCLPAESQASHVTEPTRLSLLVTCAVLAPARVRVVRSVQSRRSPPRLMRAPVCAHPQTPQKAKCRCERCVSRHLNDRPDFLSSREN